MRRRLCNGVRMFLISWSRKTSFYRWSYNFVAYMGILVNNLRSSAEKIKIETLIFQQDNDSKYMSRLAKNYFIKKRIELLYWPPQSLYLNPIEIL